MFHEGLEADDRVVAPVVRAREVPEIRSGSKDGAEGVRGKLDDSLEDRCAAHDLRSGLDEADLWIGVHGPREAHEGFSGHHAVRIENDHVAVAAAPAAAEIGDVAALAVEGNAALAVEHAAVGLKPRTEADPGAFFIDPAIGLVRVAEDEEVEGVAVTRGAQRDEHVLERAEDAGGIFVVNGHHDGGGTQRERGIGLFLDRPHDLERFADEADEEPPKRDRESERDLAEQNHEQRQQHAFQNRNASLAIEAVKHPRSRDRDAAAGGEEERLSERDGLPGEIDGAAKDHGAEKKPR